MTPTPRLPVPWRLAPLLTALAVLAGCTTLLDENRRTLDLCDAHLAPDGTTGDETYVFTLTTDDNPSFSSATTILTQTVVRSTAAGTRYVMAIPSANERYLRGTFTLGGTTPSVTYSAWVTSQEPTAWAAYPDAL